MSATPASSWPSSTRRRPSSNGRDRVEDKGPSRPCTGAALGTSARPKPSPARWQPGRRRRSGNRSGGRSSAPPQSVGRAGRPGRLATGPGSSRPPTRATTAPTSTPSAPSVDLREKGKLGSGRLRQSHRRRPRRSWPSRLTVDGPAGWLFILQSLAGSGALHRPPLRLTVFSPAPRHSPWERSRR